MKIWLLCGSFSTLTLEHWQRSRRFGALEILSVKVDLVLADTADNVRMDQNNDHADYDVLKSNDIKTLAKVLRDLISTGANTYFSPSLYKLFCIESLFLLIGRKSELLLGSFL